VALGGNGRVDSSAAFNAGVVLLDDDPAFLDERSHIGRKAEACTSTSSPTARHRILP
jgi:hypothetical protein